MSELALLALRLGFLLLLWIFIFMIIGSLRRDLVIGRRNKARQATAAEGLATGTSSVPVTSPATAGMGLSQYDGAASAGASPAGSSAPASQAPVAAAPPRTAARPAPKKLVILEGPLKGRDFELAASPLLLGRAQEATVVLDDDYASGRHARLYPQGSQWFLEDLGSTNGTFVGDERLNRAQRVGPGQLIRIGKTVMELRP